MDETHRIINIKCPHPGCGWVRAWSLPVEGYDAPVLVGLTEAVREALRRIQELFADRSVEEANAWIVLPECPHCRQPYEYNVRTGATR